MQMFFRDILLMHQWGKKVYISAVAPTDFQIGAKNASINETFIS
jgi:hypothetical protein